MKNTKILLVDDHALVREGLRLFLETTGHYHIVADVDDGHAGVFMAEVYRPDIVIMDLNMPRLDGLEATRQICENGIPTSVIILSMNASHTDVTRAVEAGARGYIHKSSVGSEVVAAIDTVLAGKLYFSPKLAIENEMILASAEVSADLPRVQINVNY